MKKTLNAALATATLIAAGSVMADRPGADWISIEQAIETAKNAGYTQVYAIEADDDGYWEGKGVKQGDDKYEFRIDGKTGEMKKDERD